MFLYSGRSTEGDKEAVLFVGPIAPATKRGLEGFKAVYSSQALRASEADALFIR